ncbi:MAG TPA: DUF3261 domain-containing protein [Parvibaculum sp.]
MSVQGIAPGVTLSLPLEQPFGGAADAVQLVQARYRNQHQIFQSVIESSDQRFTVLMTVPSGPRIMRVDWSRGSVTEKREPIAPASLSAERMLADLMLVYAPAEVLRAAIGGGILVVEADGTRRISKDGHELVVATRPAGDIWNGHARLSNIAYDYALDIQSQRAAP